MVPSFIITFMVNLIFVQAGTEIESLTLPARNYTHLDIYANALGKAHYNAWTCAYRSEPGYRCLSCSAALHCYPTDFAILVQCAGLFPYCRNGYCSRFKAEGCNEDYMVAEGTHGPLRVTTPSNDKTTTVTEEISSAGIVEQIPEESTLATKISTESADANKVEEIVTDAGALDLSMNNETDPRISG